MKPKGKYIFLIRDKTTHPHHNTYGKITQIEEHRISFKVIKWGDNKTYKGQYYYANTDRDTYVIANTIEELINKAMVESL